MLAAWRPSGSCGGDGFLLAAAGPVSWSARSAAAVPASGRGMAGCRRQRSEMTGVSRAAADPLVLAVDVGSTATRGDVYDAAGRPAGGGRCKVAHQFTTAADGTSVIDPDGVVEEVAQVIGRLAGRWRAGRIAAVAVDTFASSLVGVGAGGRAVSPCYTYADSRCAEQVAALRRELDEPAIQQLSLIHI